MLENMEWYRAFYYAAKTGSLTKAAEEMFVTQPAVTHAIKQLEAKLGGQLFFRTSKGVRLTAEGEELYSHVEAAFHFIRSGERKIAEMHELMAGEIRIGAGDTLCRHYLLPHMKAFHESFPNVKIQVTNRTSGETVELLKKGEIDLGIVNLPCTDKQVDFRRAMPLHDCIIVGQAFKHLADRRISWKELAGLPLILLEKGSSTRAFFDEYAALQSAAIKPEIELGSIDLLVEFAKTGLGAACVVRNFIGEELEAGRVFEVELDVPLPPRHVGIATLHNVPLSVAADRFIGQLLAEQPADSQPS